MYRARIPLTAAVVIAATTIAMLLSVRGTLGAAAQNEVEKRVERAQQTWPSLDLLRGIDLTNETARFARDDEFGAVFDKKGADEQRQAASSPSRRATAGSRPRGARPTSSPSSAPTATWWRATSTSTPCTTTT